MKSLTKEKVQSVLVAGGLVSLSALAVIGAQQYSADITDESVHEENNVIDSAENEISTDVLSQEEENISDILDVSSLKDNEENRVKEIQDITEHKALETSEIFGVTSTHLSLRIRKNEAIGSLSFDKVYAQKFLLENGVLDAEALEKYIAENIAFSTSGKTCAVSAHYQENNANEERLFEMYDTYSFDIGVQCQGNIENAKVSNLLFQEGDHPYAHKVSLFTRKRTSVLSLKSLLLTPKIPTLEWNTENEIPNNDADADGLLDGEEEIYGTDTNISDSDGDGDSDYKEIERGTDPLTPHTY